MVKRAFKYRFYPTSEQAELLSRTFGCVRKVWNLALEERTRAWYIEQRRVNYVDTAKMLTRWKKDPELAFLCEVSNVPLQQTLRHLQGAFANFWDKRARYPRFKSRKKSRDSATFQNNAFTYREGRLKLAKMSEPLDIVWSRPLPDGAGPSTVTVSRDSAGRWFVSLLCEDDVAQLAANDNAVGIDAGITCLVALSTGEKITNPKHERRHRRRLAKAQRGLARKTKGSRNQDRARVKVARVHARVADARRDHLHKVSTRLVRENQTIVIEDLAVRNMLRNHCLARAISDASWSEFRSMLEYKARWYGREVVVIDRWFPSSKTCADCGRSARSVPLRVREWTCRCGVTHDRDINAARNILAAGLAVTACGGGVRPQRRMSGGQSAMKQEILPVKVGIPPLREEEVNA
jgi:putative transposase